MPGMSQHKAEFAMGLTWAMWVLAACFCTKAVYLASSHSSSVRSAMLMAASSGNSSGTVGARLGDTGGRAITFGLPAAEHTACISPVVRYIFVGVLCDFLYFYYGVPVAGGVSRSNNPFSTCFGYRACLAAKTVSEILLTSP